MNKTQDRGVGQRPHPTTSNEGVGQRPHPTTSPPGVGQRPHPTISRPHTTLSPSKVDRIRGCAVGAAIGDAMGMPLEFGPRIPSNSLVREMQAGRLAAGAFTDDTEMALALAESLLTHRPLDPADLAQRFVAWYHTNPPDIGIHTASVLARIDQGEKWQQAVETVQSVKPDSAGNGSVMRCWPVALAYHNNPDLLLTDSRLQSRVTHPHQDCQAGSAFVNAVIYYLMQGQAPEEAVTQALDDAKVPTGLWEVIEAAPHKSRENLANTGWVRHTLESAIWGLLTTSSFEEAVVAVVNLGNDADTAGAVVGALTGAAYGLSGIPQRWRDHVWGQWPVNSGRRWHADDLVALADQLAEAAA